MSDSQNDWVRRVLGVDPAAPAGVSAEPSNLREKLGALAQGIAGETGIDPARRTALLGLANKANAALKNGNLQAAAALLAEAEQGLDAVPTAMASGGTATLQRAIATWRQSSEAVDGQISALQQAMAVSNDEELVEISEFGLNGITGNFRVPLMAGLASVQAGNMADAARLKRIAAAFRKHLERDKRVAACDDNPLGVAVSIRRTLVPALNAIEASLPD